MSVFFSTLMIFIYFGNCLLFTACLLNKLDSKQTRHVKDVLNTKDTSESDVQNKILQT